MQNRVGVIPGANETQTRQPEAEQSKAIGKQGKPKRMPSCM
jgi:hypothetical protein